MRRTAVVAFALGALPMVLALAPAERPPLADGPCELPLVDRARTPSTRCLSCHDGSVTRGTLLKPHVDGGGDHPVEIDYGRSFARRPRVLRPPGALPDALPLVGGKVSCTTCHDARSPEKGKPALTTRGSALCFACHSI
jgi:predicted CXXCH cytochrome family protein